MTTLTVPTPTTGPTARLQLDDPATQIMLLSWAGEAAKALSDILSGHVGVAGILTAVASIAITGFVLLAKHNTQAALIAGAAQTFAAAEPEVLAALQADVAALKSHPADLPKLAAQAVSDALGRLATFSAGPPPAPPVAPGVNQASSAPSSAPSA